MLGVSPAYGWGGGGGGQWSTSASELRLRSCSRWRRGSKVSSASASASGGVSIRSSASRASEPRRRREGSQRRRDLLRAATRVDTGKGGEMEAVLQGSEANIFTSVAEMKLTSLPVSPGDCVWVKCLLHHVVNQCPTPSLKVTCSDQPFTSTDLRKIPSNNPKPLGNPLSCRIP